MIRITLEEISDPQSQEVAGSARSEDTKQPVRLSINGESRKFTVYIKTGVLPGVGTCLMSGDDLLEELLRFEPAALSKLLSTVGKRRRGVDVDLPLLLVG